MSLMTAVKTIRNMYNAYDTHRHSNIFALGDNSIKLNGNEKRGVFTVIFCLLFFRGFEQHRPIDVKVVRIIELINDTMYINVRMISTSNQIVPIIVIENTLIIIIALHFTKVLSHNRRI